MISRLKLTQDSQINGLVLLEKVITGLHLAVQGDDLKSNADFADSTQEMFSEVLNGKKRDIDCCINHKKLLQGYPWRSFHF